MKIEIVFDSITSLKVEVDAIVNSANLFISKGGGVCGAIHDAAGYEFTEYCIKLGKCKRTECKLTPGFRLPYKYVIHAVAPVWRESRRSEEELNKTYENILKMAEENKIEKIAFPILASDHFGFPMNIAGEIAINSIKKYGNKMDEVYLVCYTEAEFLFMNAIFN